jgi:regulatory protein
VDKISQYAVKLLSIRDYTATELLRKLEAKFGNSTETATGVINDLSAKGFLDDRRYVQNYLRRKPGFGPERVRAELLERGVASTIVEQELAEAERPSLRAILDATMTGWNLSYPMDSSDVARVFRRLARLGYPEDDIREELERFNG